MNKQRRKELEFFKYKKRLKRWVAGFSCWRTEDGEWVENPSLDFFIKNNLYTKFKQSSVLCSCWMCSKEWKYKRHLKRLEDQQLIREGLAENYGEFDSAEFQ